jgi:hypothetical protein
MQMVWNIQEPPSFKGLQLSSAKSDKLKTKATVARRALESKAKKSWLFVRPSHALVV